MMPSATDRDPAGPGTAPVDGSAMRKVLGHFASGVAVVTALDRAGPVGFTCQSLTSLSLDPPLVSLAPARTSSAWSTIRSVGTFGVNILAEDHQRYSAQFARRDVDRFAGVGWSAGPGGAPLLHGVVAWVACDLEHEYDGGDHTIAVGRVRGLGTGRGVAPLLFHRGGYGITRGE